MLDAPGEPTLSRDLQKHNHRWMSLKAVKLVVPCTSVSVEQVKDSTHGGKSVTSFGLLTPHQSTLVRGKNLP